MFHVPVVVTKHPSIGTLLTGCQGLCCGQRDFRCRVTGSPLHPSRAPPDPSRAFWYDTCTPHSTIAGTCLSCPELAAGQLSQPFLDLQRALPLDLQHTLSGILLSILENPAKEDLSDRVKFLALKFFDDDYGDPTSTKSSRKHRNRVNFHIRFAKICTAHPSLELTRL